MATTKKTTAAKKATAPKKAPEKYTVKADPVEQLELPHAPEPQPVAADEMVSYVIPRDPSFEANDQYFEWNLNGINYRFKRGEVLTHPRSFYEEVAAKLQLREHISPEVAEFMNKSKKLN